MGNMVINVCSMSNYDRLHVDKALGDCMSDKKKNRKNNVCSVSAPQICRSYSIIGNFAKITVLQ